MKNVIYVILSLIAIIGLSVFAGYLAHRCIDKHNEQEIIDTIDYVTIESIIANDIAYMDTVSNDYSFFECRVVLPEPFNEMDDFDYDEVTNVFQFVVKDEQENDIPNVYMFIHNNDTTIIEKHTDAFMTDDIAMNFDDISVTFGEAFELARYSDYTPSTSKYITLRHGFGRYECNPFYSIGNSEYGHLWVDAYTGDVMDIDPASKEK